MPATVPDAEDEFDDEQAATLPLVPCPLFPCPFFHV